MSAQGRIDDARARERQRLAQLSGNQAEIAAADRNLAMVVARNALEAASAGAKKGGPDAGLALVKARGDFLLAAEAYAKAEKLASAGGSADRIKQADRRIDIVGAELALARAEANLARVEQTIETSGRGAGTGASLLERARQAQEAVDRARNRLASLTSGAKGTAATDVVDTQAFASSGAPTVSGPNLRTQAKNLDTQAAALEASAVQAYRDAMAMAKGSTGQMTRLTAANALLARAQQKRCIANAKRAQAQDLDRANDTARTARGSDPLSAGDASLTSAQWLQRAQVLDAKALMYEREGAAIKAATQAKLHPDVLSQDKATTARLLADAAWSSYAQQYCEAVAQSGRGSGTIKAADPSDPSKPLDLTASQWREKAREFAAQGRDMQAQADYLASLASGASSEVLTAQYNLWMNAKWESTELRLVDLIETEKANITRLEAIGAKRTGNQDGELTTAKERLAQLEAQRTYFNGIHQARQVGSNLPQDPTRLATLQALKARGDQLDSVLHDRRVPVDDRLLDPAQQKELDYIHRVLEVEDPARRTSPLPTPEEPRLVIGNPQGVGQKPLTNELQSEDWLRKFKLGRIDTVSDYRVEVWYPEGFDPTQGLDPMVAGLAKIASGEHAGDYEGTVRFQGRSYAVRVHEAADGKVEVYFSMRVDGKSIELAADDHKVVKSAASAAAWNGGAAVLRGVEEVQRAQGVDPWFEKLGGAGSTAQSHLNGWLANGTQIQARYDAALAMVAALPPSAIAFSDATIKLEEATRELEALKAWKGVADLEHRGAALEDINRARLDALSKEKAFDAAVGKRKNAQWLLANPSKNPSASPYKYMGDLNASKSLAVMSELYGANSAAELDKLFAQQWKQIAGALVEEFYTRFGEQSFDIESDRQLDNIVAYCLYGPPDEANWADLTPEQLREKLRLVDDPLKLDIEQRAEVKLIVDSIHAVGGTNAHLTVLRGVSADSTASELSQISLFGVTGKDGQRLVDRDGHAYDNNQHYREWNRTQDWDHSVSTLMAGGAIRRLADGQFDLEFGDARIEGTFEGFARKYDTAITVATLVLSLALLVPTGGASTAMLAGLAVARVGLGVAMAYGTVATTIQLYDLAEHGGSWAWLPWNNREAGLAWLNLAASVLPMGGIFKGATGLVARDLRALNRLERELAASHKRWQLDPTLDNFKAHAALYADHARQASIYAQQLAENSRGIINGLARVGGWFGGAAFVYGTADLLENLDHMTEQERDHALFMLSLNIASTLPLHRPVGAWEAGRQARRQDHREALLRQAAYVHTKDGSLSAGELESALAPYRNEPPETPPAPLDAEGIFANLTHLVDLGGNLEVSPREAAAGGSHLIVFAPREAIGAARIESAFGIVLAPSDVVGVDFLGPAFHGGLPWGKVSLKGPYLDRDMQPLSDDQQAKAVDSARKKVLGNTVVDAHVVDLFGLSEHNAQRMREALESPQVQDVLHKRGQRVVFLEGPDIEVYRARVAELLQTPAGRAFLVGDLPAPDAQAAPRRGGPLDTHHVSDDGYAAENTGLGPGAEALNLDKVLEGEARFVRERPAYAGPRSAGEQVDVDALDAAQLAELREQLTYLIKAGSPDGHTARDIPLRHRFASWVTGRAPNFLGAPDFVGEMFVLARRPDGIDLSNADAANETNELLDRHHVYLSSAEARTAAAAHRGAEGENGTGTTWVVRLVAPKRELAAVAATGHFSNGQVDGMFAVRPDRSVDPVSISNPYAVHAPRPGDVFVDPRASQPDSAKVYTRGEKIRFAFKTAAFMVGASAAFYSAVRWGGGSLGWRVAGVPLNEHLGTQSWANRFATYAFTYRATVAGSRQIAKFRLQKHLSPDHENTFVLLERLADPDKRAAAIFMLRRQLAGMHAALGGVGKRRSHRQALRDLAMDPGHEQARITLMRGAITRNGKRVSGLRGAWTGVPPTLRLKFKAAMERLQADPTDAGAMTLMLAAPTIERGAKHAGVLRGRLARFVPMERVREYASALSKFSEGADASGISPEAMAGLQTLQQLPLDTVQRLTTGWRGAVRGISKANRHSNELAAETLRANPLDAGASAVLDLTPGQLAGTDTPLGRILFAGRVLSYGMSNTAGTRLIHDPIVGPRFWEGDLTTMEGLRPLVNYLGGVVGVEGNAAGLGASVTNWVNNFYRGKTGKGVTIVDKDGQPVPTYNATDERSWLVRMLMGLGNPDAIKHNGMLADGETRMPKPSLPARLPQYSSWGDTLGVAAVSVGDVLQAAIWLRQGQLHLVAPQLVKVLADYGVFRGVQKDHNSEWHNNRGIAQTIYHTRWSSYVNAPLGNAKVVATKISDPRIRHGMPPLVQLFASSILRLVADAVVNDELKNTAAPATPPAPAPAVPVPAAPWVHGPSIRPPDPQLTPPAARNVFWTVDDAIKSRSTIEGMARAKAKRDHMTYGAALDQLFQLNPQFKRNLLDGVITKKPGDPDLLIDGQKINTGVPANP